MSETRGIDGRLGALTLLAVACLSQACVSARPWRSCGPPCGRKQLAHAGAVLVYTNDHTHLLLTHASAGEDENGAYLTGKGRINGNKLPSVKIYLDVVCAIHTRRVELGRIAENVVLVPLALAGEIVLAGVTNTDVEGWEIPDEPLPPRICAPPEAAAKPPGDNG